MDLRDWFECVRDCASRYLNKALADSPTPEFAFELGWYTDYDALFRNSNPAKTQISALIDSNRRGRRSIISARGGAAKSRILHLLGREVLRRDRSLPIYIDLKAWSPAHDRQWEGLTNSVERLNFLFTAFSYENMSIALIDLLPSDVTSYIFVDGLNEVATATAQTIIKAADDVISYAPSTRLVLCDRLVRRLLQDGERWSLATVMPLSEDEIRKHLQATFGTARMYDDADEATKELLSTPIFLNAKLRGGNGAADNSAGVFHNYFRDNVSLSNEDLDLAADAAFRAYADDRSRTFSVASFEQITRKPILDKLVAARALIVDGDLGFFDHHLKHDYLASIYVATHSAEWGPTLFDTATFSASSFDAMSMALQQIRNEREADQFVQFLYDWNLYGSAYALTEGRVGAAQTTSVSEEMEIVVMSMLAVRLWDPILSTREKARDALMLFPGKNVDGMLSVPSRGELAAFVPESAKHDWYTRWRGVFSLLLSEDEIDVGDVDVVAVVTSAESILGWTWANTLKRARLTGAQQAALREALQQKDLGEVVRWRVAHVLGVFPTEENAAALLASLSMDEAQWVRYGATRSLVEMAAMTPDDTLRSEITRHLLEKRTIFDEDHRSARELRSSMLVSREVVTAGWVRIATPLVQQFYAPATSEDEQAEWIRLAYDMRSEYQGDQVVEGK